MIEFLLKSGPRSVWAADGLALLAGAVLPFAFSPFEIWPLAVVAPALLFSVWLQAGPRRALWRGWLFGLGSFGLGVSWILSSFKFANVALPLAVILMLGFIAFLSLYPALTGYFLARIAGTGKFGKPGGERCNAQYFLALLPAGLIFSEWLRGWFLSGFGWLQLGYSQVDGPLRGLLPVVGVYGVSLLLAVTAGACAWGAVEFRRKLVWGVAVLVIAIWGAAIGVRHYAWTQAAGDVLQVALIQGNIAQDQKWLPRMRLPILQRYLKLTQQQLDARLIVWPETAVPGTPQRVAGYLQQLSKLAVENGVSILYGIPEFDPLTRKAYNSTFMTGVDKGRYRKRHLVPFGEYLPVDFLLRPIVNLLNIPVSNFSRGDLGQPLLTVDGVKIAMYICYEIAFGQQVAQRLPEATLLATVSNDAWFGDSIGPHQHLQIARARAIETGRYLLRATNTGLSAIVDPFGVVQGRSPQFKVHTLRAEVQPMVGTTPYVRWGDWPVLGVVVLLLLFVAGYAHRRA